jgi:spore maturation protein CgeB
MTEPMRIVILGLSITSSWGNGHATTFRALIAQLSARGHDVLFLERDVPWYASHRDLPDPPYCRTELYRERAELMQRFATDVAEADLVIVGSFVPEGIEVGAWVQRTALGVTAFYDIDTPVTLGLLDRGQCEYLSPEVDAEIYQPQALTVQWDLGYMGTYSPDRQPALERLLLKPARQARHLRFLVAGPKYPDNLHWPENVSRLAHVEPARHPWLYCSQRFTLNLTRADMVAAGHSPSVRLFEAAACGTPIISDYWEGLERLLVPGREILVADSTRDVLGILADVSESERVALGRRARERVLAAHTSAHRARELERYVGELMAREPAP